MTVLLRSEREQLAIDLRSLRGALIRGRFLAVALSCFVFIAGIGVILMLDRTYDAEAITVAAELPANSATGVGSIAALAASVGIAAPGSGSLNEALAVLTSRSFVGAFIAERNLKPVLFESSWDGSVGRWREGWLSSEPTDSDAYEKFVGDVLHVEHDPVTGLVTVRVTWKDPQQGALWANELVERLNGEMRDRAIKDSDDMLLFLDRELESTKLLSVRESIFRLLESQLSSKAIATVRNEFALRFVDRAVPKDAKNFDHPRVALLAVMLALVALMMGLVGGALWGAVKVRKERASADNLKSA
jgi:uncharacterized protein involved in exopolysaccharide biosynthesis